MRHRALRSIGLFGLLVAIYFLTYSGDPISTDEWVYFDGLRSTLLYNIPELAYTSTLRPVVDQPNNVPVIQLDVEPMQIYFSAPLFWLGRHISGIGLMQTVWLFNILTTALTAVLLYHYGLALGYKARTAIALALIFGLATTAWPYSKMFFREPLFTLLVLIAAYSLEKWRQHVGRLQWALLAALALVAALFTKEAGLLIIPTLVFIAAPGTIRRLFNWRSAVVAVVLAVLIVGAIKIYPHLFVGTRFGDVLQRVFAIRLDSVDESLPAFLMSPGFSIWGFSPVLLLGFAGAYLLLRKRQLRQVAVPLVALLSLTVGYSVFQGVRWYGGTGWGPRYLLPLVPFLSLWLLPVLESFLDRRAPRGVQIAAVGLIVQSIFVQIFGVAVPVKAFPNYLYFEGVSLSSNDGIPPWQAGTWNPLYLPQVVTAHQARSPSPIAWIVDDSGLIVVPLCLIAAAAALWALTQGCPSRRVTWLSAGAVGLSVLIMFYSGLRTYYTDPRYTGNNPALWTVLDRLNADMRPGDTVILNDGAYSPFFMNTYKRRDPIYVMPDARGERLTPPEPSLLEQLFPDKANDPEAQAAPYSNIMLPRIALKSTRWWFLTEFGPFSQNRLRPTEHFLVRHFFRLQEVFNDSNIRLIQFAPISAPPDRVPPWPQNPLDVDFGAARLVGYDLPKGTTAKPGDLLPVSLLWHHEGWPSDLAPFDYSINVSLIRKAETLTVAQNSGQPMGTFAPMSLWVKGGYYRDNVGLELPADLAPGDYDLWVLVFDWRDNTKLHLRNRADPADHYVITSIHIE